DRMDGWSACDGAGVGDQCAKRCAAQSGAPCAPHLTTGGGTVPPNQRRRAGSWATVAYRLASSGRICKRRADEVVIHTTERKGAVAASSKHTSGPAPV